MRFPTKLLQVLMMGVVFLLPTALIGAQETLDAVDDMVFTNVNTPVAFDVLANDAGPLDPASAAAIDAPAGGVLIPLGSGMFEYTPATDFTGMVTFSYQVCDTGTPVTCDTAMVTISVAVSFAPIAADDAVTTEEDTPVTIFVLANDFDPDGDLDPTSVTVTGGPANGTADVNADGSITYTPVLNYFGPDGLTYNVCDLSGQCSSASVSIEVTPVNDPPDCSAAYPSISVLWPPNHQMVSVQILGVTDVEGDPFTLTITSISVNEPDNGTGDGDTSGDTGGIGTDTAQVRAERAGGGDGRVYEITFVADDGLENGASTCSVPVTVPHDQGDELPLPEATEEVVQPGDFGCDHPGNYCNAPGQNKETVEEQTQSQDQTRNNNRNNASQNADNGKKDDHGNKDKDKDQGNNGNSGNSKGKGKGN